MNIILSKLLKIVILVLLFITVGELGYYLYYQFDLKKNNQDLSSTVNNNELKICVPVDDSSSVLNTAILEQLKHIPAALVSSTVTNTYQGKIIELNLQGGRIPINKSKYKNTSKEFIEYLISLKVKSDKETESLDYYWDNDSVSKIKVWEKDGNTNKSIDLNALSVGNEVNVEETIDLMNKNCVSFQCMKGFNIYKIIKN